ncbi:MAG TPA: transcriptional regulator [Candidatus Bathyarchaeota archaeon]|nr:transcriptional regulator [Candidatus Bathyarchaeota archaeon]
MAGENQEKSNSSPRVRKRSDIDIIANILSAAKKGAKKTHIIYSCNLSHSQLQVYLQILHDMGLLDSHSKKEGAELNYLKTTSKGLKFLDAYSTLKSLMT